jgi:Zn-dependent alcohol dehydrogenase
MGTSTFSNYIVVPKLRWQIRRDAVRDGVLHRLRSHHGCRRRRAREGRARANVVVFGLGGIGLNVVQGARMVGADKIIGIDINPQREAIGRRFGMTHFIDAKKTANVVDEIVQLTDGGADFSFECIGNTATMRQALVLPGVGAERHHRRGNGERNRDAAIPARDRPRMEAPLSAAHAATPMSEDRRLVWTAARSTSS